MRYSPKAISLLTPSPTCPQKLVSLSFYRHVRAHTQLLKTSKILKGFPFVLQAVLIIIVSNACQKCVVFLKNNQGNPEEGLMPIF